MLKNPNLSAKWAGMIRPGSEPALRSIVSKPESEKEKERGRTNLMMEIKYKDNEADICDGTKSV